MYTLCSFNFPFHHSIPSFHSISSPVIRDTLVHELLPSMSLPQTKDKLHWHAFPWSLSKNTRTQTTWRQMTHLLWLFSEYTRRRSTQGYRSLPLAPIPHEDGQDRQVFSCSFIAGSIPILLSSLFAFNPNLLLILLPFYSNSCADPFHSLLPF